VKFHFNPLPFEGQRRVHLNVAVGVQLPLCVWASSNRFSNSTQRATSVFICFRYSVVFGSRCGKIELQFNATFGGKRDEPLVGNPFFYIRHRRCVTSLGDSNGFSRRFLAHNKLKLGHNITVNKCHRISVLTSVCVCLKYAFSKKNLNSKHVKIEMKMESVWRRSRSSV